MEGILGGVPPTGVNQALDDDGDDDEQMVNEPISLAKRNVVSSDFSSV